jgi:hypothetical protein
MKPFITQNAAVYYGGGVIAEDVSGGFWSLHAVTHPNGVDFYCAGSDGGHEGWPKTLKRKHCFGQPDNGGARCICLL